jgi:hypothetical protein
MIFDAIDLKKRTARIISNQGATDVVAITTLTGITFIEQTGGESIDLKPLNECRSCRLKRVANFCNSLHTQDLFIVGRTDPRCPVLGF